MGEKLKEMVFNRFFKDKSKEIEKLREEVVKLKNIVVKQEEQLIEEQTQRIEYQNIEMAEQERISSELIGRGNENDKGFNEENVVEIFFFKLKKDFNLEDGTFVNKGTGFLVEGKVEDKFEIHFEISDSNTFTNDTNEYLLPFDFIKEYGEVLELEPEEKEVNDTDNSVINKSKEIASENEVTQLENYFANDKLPGDIESIFESETIYSKQFNNGLENNFSFKNYKVNNFSLDNIFDKNKNSEIEME